MDNARVVDAPVDRIVRPAEAAHILGVGRSSLYRLADQGKLPKPIRVTPACSGWRESWLREYLDERESEARDEDQAA